MTERPTLQALDGCQEFDERLLESVFAPIPDAMLDEHLGSCSRCQNAREHYIETADVLAAVLATSHPPADEREDALPESRTVMSRSRPARRLSRFAAAGLLLTAAGGFLLFRVLPLPLTWSVKNLSVQPASGAVVSVEANTARIDHGSARFDVQGETAIVQTPVGRLRCGEGSFTVTVENRQGSSMNATTKGAAIVTVAVITGTVWWLQADGTERTVEAGEQVMLSEEPSGMPGLVARRVELSPVAPSVDLAELEDDPDTVPFPFAEVGAEQAITVHGRVVDDVSGLPVPGARIRIGWSISPASADPTSETDAEGGFTVEGVTAYLASTEIAIAAAGYASRIEQLATLSPELLRSVSQLVSHDFGTIRLVHGARLSGGVETPTGMPVAGAFVLLFADRSSVSFRPDQVRRVAVTAADGSFVLDGLAPDRHETQALIAVSDQGIGWNELSIPHGRDELPELHIVVRPTGSLTVTVTDSSGQPIAGASVVAEPRFSPFVIYGTSHPPRSILHVEQPDLARILTAETNASGQAKLRELPVGDQQYSPFQIAASAKGYVSSWRLGVALDSEIKLVLARDVPCLISGHVRTLDGDPIADARIGILQGLPYGLTPVPANVRTHSAADGSYSSELPPEVTLTLAVRAEGFALGLHEVRTVSGGNLEDEDIVLVPAEPIAGRVIDSFGEPVPFTVVSARRDNLVLHGETWATDRSGAFFVGDATEGEWTLELRLPPPLEQWTTWRLQQVAHAGDREVVVTATRRASRGAHLVAELVELGSGRPLDAVEASLWPVEPGFIARVTREHGQVTAESLQPGHWRLRFRVAEGTRGSRTFEVLPSDSEIRLRIEVEPPGVVSGRVLLGDLAPDERLTVSMKRGGGVWADSPGNRVARKYEGLNPDGTFRFEGVTPGLAKLDLVGRFPGSALVNVSSGEEVYVEIRPEAGAWLNVSSGAPLPLGEGRLWIAAGEAEWALADAAYVKSSQNFYLTAALPTGPVRWRVLFRPLDAEGREQGEEKELGEGAVDVVADQDRIDVRLE